MKVTYELNLPEDQDEKDAIDGRWRLHDALNDIYQTFRNMKKHRDQENITTDEALGIVCDILNTHGVEL